MCRVSVSFNQKTSLTRLRVLGSRGLSIMPDVNVVEEYRLEVASGIRRLFVVGQHSFDMRELAAARVMAPCSLGAYSGFAVACRRGLAEVEDVAEKVLRGTRRHLGRRRRFRRYPQVRVRSSKPTVHVLVDVSGLN
jgi:hypothetical protein